MIVTLGERGAIASLGDGSYFIPPVSTPVVSSVGAGDGVLAGMALAYFHKKSPEYGLKHGFALAGAVLQRLATADFRVESYQELLSHICIRPL